ncbi:MAG: acyl carrier protein [Candidatus Dadabacteria bacterium]|nr:acyl carrier protein [Candidatus Dadabacteria bacterium]
MQDDIKARIRKVLGRKLRDIDVGAIADEALLIEYGVGADSVATLELLVALEGEFGVSIDESAVTLAELESVSAMAGFIAKLLERGG